MRSRIRWEYSLAPGYRASLKLKQSDAEVHFGLKLHSMGFGSPFIPTTIRRLMFMASMAVLKCLLRFIPTT